MTGQSLRAIVGVTATLLAVSVVPTGAQATAIVQGAVGEHAAGRFYMHNAMPRRAGTVTAQLAQGHGDLDILQQPTAANNYTAVLRVRDREEGYGHYDFDVVVDRR